MLICLSCLLTFACSDPPAPQPEAYVIRAGSIMVTVKEFADEMDLKLTAYPFDLKTRPEAYNTMVLDLVTILSDEAVLMAEALACKIGISPEELEAAEGRFRADYPDDSFEQMLLENAISYQVWKKRLKKDMVISKLINDQLIRNMEISPEDVVSFYARYGKGQEGQERLDEAQLVKQLRMEKSQAAYDSWLAGLKTRYPLEINKRALAAFLKDTSIEKGKQNG